MMRAILLAGLLFALPAHAHQLVIYAYAEGGEVVVEATFSNGNPAKLGEIRLLDQANALLQTVPLDDDGETRIAVPAGAEGGLVVEVETDAGHTDYWVLTPADLGGEQ